MRRVLHLRMVTQCAMLEEFGIFLVLADKVRGLFLSVLSTFRSMHIVTLCVSYRSPRALIASSNT